MGVRAATPIGKAQPAAFQFRFVTAWRIYFDPDEQAINNENDVWAPDCAKTVEVLRRIYECAGIIL